MTQEDPRAIAAKKTNTLTSWLGKSRFGGALSRILPQGRELRRPRASRERARGHPAHGNLVGTGRLKVSLVVPYKFICSHKYNVNKYDHSILQVHIKL